jgi:phosphatidylglycerophosphate synthase
MSSLVKPLSAKPVLKFSLTVGVSAAFAAVALIVVGVESVLPLTGGFAVRSLAACAGVTLSVAWLARRHLQPATFGAANCVTIVRATLVAPLVGLLGEAPTAALAWLAIAIGIVVLVLDGVDGRLARHAGEATRFGARFDMESDALLILVLSALCFQFGKAGIWILGAGLLRYVFVAAARVVPWMRGALPESRRRQTVCVVQIVALFVCLSPPVARPSSALAGALGLAVLAWSFLVDIRWLARQA